MSYVVLRGRVINAARGQAGINPGLSPPRNKNEVCVPSEGTWAILGQCLRCKYLVPKTGSFRLPPSSAVFFSKWKNFLLSREDSESIGWVAAAPTLCESSLTLGFRVCAVQRAVSDVESHAFTEPASVLMSTCSP